jgi:AsmA family
MNRVHKLLRWAFWLAALIVGVQLTVSFALRTKRIHGYLIAHLERAFGRPVEVSQFSAEILPVPRLDMDGVTIGEDPAFGNEYFLRADRMQAGLRWMGLMKGQFLFGTMSLTRPSLILVRNANGRWNLEDWLPPSAARVASYAEDKAFYGPQASASPSNFLQKIEFDNGRINFKFEDEKRPFAFTNVSGDVEQTGPGRWQLNLEAKPWRSGVALQSAGVLYVRGDVAGTSARLQPAKVTVHWGGVSLADLFRLATGKDFGVRGEFGLDGTASVGVAKEGEATAPSGHWDYEVQARATQVHRWDLTERNDNPKVSVKLRGVWDLLANEVRSRELSMELPQSNFHGTVKFGTKQNSEWRLHLESAAIEGSDILAWCRAFQAGVAEGVTADQFFTGRGSVVGWPWRWEEGEISSEGGTVRVPGLSEPVRVGAVRGGFHGNEFSMDPVRVTFHSGKLEDLNTAKGERPAAKTRDSQDWAEFGFVHNALLNSGTIHVDGHLDQADYFFKTAAAFGKTLNHGWELNGGVGSAAEWGWTQGMFRNGRWNGSINFAKAELQAAGLNQPIELEDARLELKDGRRSVIVAKATAFGATWSGTIGEDRLAIEGELPLWEFRLHADHLDATELDRWVGPRARPNWLRRLLPSLLGDSSTGGKPSELLRRISAEGELSADTVSVEKIKLSKAHAKINLRDLHLDVREAEAQWVGGNVGLTLQANFVGTPNYDIFAQVEHANLSQLPWLPGWSDRWNGSASGKLRLTTAGIGRDELLSHIDGRGDIEFKNVEFRGWDVANSLESNTTKIGISHWTTGEGEFQVKDREVSFDAIQFDGGGRTKIWLAGSLGFGKDMALAFRSAPVGTRDAARGANVRVLQINGPTESPQISLENISAGKSKP